MTKATTKTEEDIALQQRLSRALDYGASTWESLVAQVAGRVWRETEELVEGLFHAMESAEEVNGEEQRGFRYTEFCRQAEVKKEARKQIIEAQAKQVGKQLREATEFAEELIAKHCDEPDAPLVSSLSIHYAFDGDDVMGGGRLAIACARYEDPPAAQRVFFNALITQIPTSLRQGDWKQRYCFYLPQDMLTEIQHWLRNTSSRRERGFLLKYGNLYFRGIKCEVHTMNGRKSRACVYLTEAVLACAALQAFELLRDDGLG